jgi:DNA-binding NarL/FixJ family response regulator
MDTARYRIIVADDHELVLQRMKMILGQRSDFVVIGEARDGVELLKLLEDVAPSLVILDITMPNLSGLEAARKIKKDHPDVKILVRTMHRDEEYLYHALLMGADGYILKDDFISDLFIAIEKIRQGSVYITPSLRSKLEGIKLAMPSGEPGEGTTRD